jgi:hypothetical protein
MWKSSEAKTRSGQQFAPADWLGVSVRSGIAAINGSYVRKLLIKVTQQLWLWRHNGIGQVHKNIIALGSCNLREKCSKPVVPDGV